MNNEVTLLENIQSLNLLEGTNEVLVATARNLQALGNLYLQNSQPEKAGNAYWECLNSCHQLAMRDADNFQQLNDETFSAIANEYISDGLAGQFPTTLIDIAQAISPTVLYDALKHLAAASPDTYNPIFAKNIRSLAELRYLATDFIAAEKYYEEAVELYEASLSSDDYAYFEDLATLLPKLAELKLRRELPHIAIDLVSRSSTLWEALAEANPDKYMISVARSFYKCATLMHNEFRNHAQAALYLEKSIVAWDVVNIIYPGQYDEETTYAKQALAKLTDKSHPHSSQIFIH